MGRMQTFDSGVVVQAARNLFWDKGFDGASLAELEAATGVGRSSLYHAFGSKRGLFDAAVTDYLETVIRPRLAGLRAGPRDSSALLEYFAGLARATVTQAPDSAQTGCLLVNCAVGLAAHDEPTRAVVEGYRIELAEALRHALENAAAPSPSAAESVDERVRTLTSLSISAMLMARVNRDEAIALLSTASNQIRDWFPDPVI
ncbi:transcriptional regulator, TetR family [Cryobacterium flavum]|uniref:TetR/AcrR family transcriptional regulator n=2 Tax=Microbacteriaceae TaxID=85023 RepID=A0A4R8V4K7_9MICO|nr:TetR/AcrR family transcriptional regulator [Cryobacterium flavum]TFB76020.1 TetR/AcrR family transcriptional regulator [Cryobacterium flavum]SDO03947.1 transcriptional regulator, TetR family [Cryobacterium flavum]